MDTEKALRAFNTILIGTEGLNIIGPDGKPWTLAELSAWWGAEIRVLDPAQNEYANYAVYVKELRVTEGPCTQIVRVVDEGGNPIEGVAVGRWWSTAPMLPTLPPDCYATYLHERGVIGLTGANGDVGFGMGQGDAPGTSDVWVIHCDAPSGAVLGLGWKFGTNHQAIIVTFQVLPLHITPPPPPGECPVEEIEAELAKIDGTVSVLREMLPAVRTGLTSIKESTSILRGLIGE